MKNTIKKNVHTFLLLINIQFNITNLINIFKKFFYKPKFKTFFNMYLLYYTCIQTWLNIF